MSAWSQQSASVPLLRREAITAFGSSSASFCLLFLVGLSCLPVLDAQASLLQLAVASPTAVHHHFEEEAEDSASGATAASRVGAVAPVSSSRRRRRQDPVPPAALVALSGTSSRGGHHGATDHHKTRLLAKRKEVPAGWFGGYAEDESTYDDSHIYGDHPDNPEEIAARVSQDGNTVNMGGQEDPIYMPETGLPSDWFEESKSAGPSAAWRTRFPPLEAFRNEGMKTVPWLPSNNERQTHIPSAATGIARAFDFTKKKDAPWFDSSIADIDDFGRKTPPSPNSDSYYWDWEEKSWSVPFGCSNPGCVANASLQTFNAAKLQHAKCRLSVGVHATDFDDEYSREFVEWIIVNGAWVSTRCDPMAHGCNNSVADKDRGLHPCVSDYPIDNLFQLDKGTNLNIAGKISDMVDECPVGNNLLSGEAKVTCLVKPKTTPPTAMPVVIPNNAFNDTCSNTTALRCSEHGCVAKATALACRPPQKGEKCLMSVRIWQTDFDNDHGSVEVVEYIKVNGNEIAKDLKPGRNPCKEVYEGKAPTNASLAARNGDSTPTPEPISLDAQSQALLAPLPGDAQSPTAGCRRRVLDPLQASSFLKETDAQRRVPIAVNHLRAAPDDMKEIVSGKDITKEVLKSAAVDVEAKISRKVDECAKDGWLLNAEVTIVCK